MDRLKSSYQILKTKGLRSLVNKCGQYVLVNSPVSPLLKKALGENLHQKLYIYLRLGYWPQIQNPRTFNEKILHRKLYTDKDIFSTVEDKWAVREYVKEKTSDEILTEVYHLTDDPETIPFEELPESFVIKPTHLSGPIKLVDGEFDPESIRQECRKWLNQTYGELKKEYWYEQIEPQILIEERLHEDEHGVPLDYKLFVFHGIVEYIEVDFDRFSGHTRRFYDRDWNPQEFTLKFPKGPVIDRPDQLDEMIEIAEQLGESFEFIRVDLYQPNGEKVVFGELTVAHGSGGEPFTPQRYDFELGALW